VFDRLRAHLAEEQSPVLDIGGAVVEVDTTDFTCVDYQGILNQVRSLMAEGQGK
jgi:hypothetical protein